MSSCPCCSYPLLRHIRHSQVDWFCQHCWQFMPDFSTPMRSSQSLSQFHNQVDLVTIEPEWNREPDHHPQRVSLSDSLRFKNAKPTREKTGLLTSQKTQPLTQEKTRRLVGIQEIL
ncbi:hypothetical protein J0895_12460 [Phormidium pseudopriestleyi FRX01]|uniref:Uncharacterized protein n=1 Tax=Phormidium pseudopriestleyi FRX01 TaxID=1759528 RepID=A0ABS3FS29_9CYAN|nr:hypothetical protein [Phormidium pseudopriestleyi]MBO0349911.1 hypothetical protein [Phormidium pseudopriestleyi FRX01]